MAQQKKSDQAIPHSKRTKMLATLGPATSSYEMIRELLNSGVNGFRLNFSHGVNEERIEQIKWIRKASKELDKPVAIVQDLQGPKIRLGDFEGTIEVKVGDELRFGYETTYETSGIIPVQYDVSKRVKRGEMLLLNDGRVRTRVTSVRNNTVSVTAESAGQLSRRKGMNLPDTDFGGDIITAKDRADIRFGSDKDIDYVALSFVQTAKDITKLRTMLNKLGSTAKIIAKIETKAATENLEEIIVESDAVMVARGDLASETLPESVPTITRTIVGLAQEHRKISIIATQMLASMTDSPDPTRAEVSDVATATIVGADCVMLSDETTVGKYPIETVKMMRRIILYTQENTPLKPVFYREEDRSMSASVTSAITTLAHQVGAKAIVAETASGATALAIASRRPNMPIIMVSHNQRVVNQLTLAYGGKTYLRKAEQKTATKLTKWLQSKHRFEKGDTVVSAAGQYPGISGGTDTIKVRILK